VFLAVVEEGSFTSAARRLAITVSQVSRAVNALETRLKTRLLQRTTRRIALTTAGERYRERASQIIVSVDAAEFDARQLNARPSGTLRVHATSSFGHAYVVPAVVAYRARYPEVFVDLTLSQSFPDLVEEGFDISFQLSARRLPDSVYVARHLGTLFSVLCASPTYLEKCGTPKTIEDLTEHACLPLVSAVSSGTHWDFEATGGIEKFDIPFCGLKMNSADAVARTVVESAAIAALPLQTALPLLKNGVLRRVLPGRRLQRIESYLVYPSRKYNDAKSTTFIELSISLIQEALSGELVKLDRIEKEITSATGPTQSTNGR
jgi:DNA-binding transcriptional LysR family regulator